MGRCRRLYASTGGNMTRGFRVAALTILLVAGCGDKSGTGGPTADAPVMFDAPPSPGAGAGAPTTCIVGTQGCLCDSTGGCANNLTCTPQPSPRPNLCCNGTDCTSVGGTVGASCSAPTGAPSCTPGVTIPPAVTPNDNCGYPASSFIESTTIVGIGAGGGGSPPAIIRVF